MASEAQVIGGHKANLHNPNTSAEAKEHSKEVLKEDFNSKQPCLPIPLKHSASLPPPALPLDVLLRMLTFPATVIVDGNKTKDLDHVEAGLKGYVSDRAKFT